MPLIVVQTFIRAPIERCFDLSRSIDLHMLSMTHTNERAIAGRTSGLINAGEQVTWEAKHFSINQQLTVGIGKMDQPFFFSDSMIKGAFKSMNHDHIFEQHGDHTLMTDRFNYEVPYSIAGLLFDKLVLNRYMKALLQRRNEELKRIAEGNDWKKLLQ